MNTQFQSFKTTLRNLRTTSLGQVFYHLPETVSTQDVMRTLSSHGAVAGTTVMTDRQIAGRGRRGREWLSIPGEQLYFSIYIKPFLPLSQFPLLNLGAGVAIADALEAIGIDEVSVKWPNDVLLDGKKVSGVLSEVANESGVIMGIGINVSGDHKEIPVEIGHLATTIQMKVGKVDRWSLLVAILERLEFWWDRIQAGDLEQFLVQFHKVDFLGGNEVRVEQEGSGFVGTARGIDETGTLLVETDSGEIRKVVAADVKLTSRGSRR